MSFELQPARLQGELLELRPLAPADFDALYAAASDPLIWEQHPEPDRHQRDVFEKFFASAIESRGALVVIERATGDIIGSSRYTRLDLELSQVEVGWTFLARRFWGGAYNRELKTLMLDHAFRFVERVMFTVGENNLRSQKALGKIGARLVGAEERIGLDGKLRANVVFAITKEEWSAQKGNHAAAV